MRAIKGIITLMIAKDTGKSYGSEPHSEEFMPMIKKCVICLSYRFFII